MSNLLLEPRSPPGVHLTPSSHLPCVPAMLGLPEQHKRTGFGKKKGRSWWLLDPELALGHISKQNKIPLAPSLLLCQTPPIAPPTSLLPFPAPTPCAGIFRLKGLPSGKRRRTPKHLDPLRFLWLRNPGVPPSSSLSLITQRSVKNFLKVEPLDLNEWCAENFCSYNRTNSSIILSGCSLQLT